MTQALWLELLEGERLTAWRRDRRLSLKNFVGLIAERRVATIPCSDRGTCPRHLERFLNSF